MFVTIEETKGTADAHSNFKTTLPVDRSIPAFELSYATSRLDKPGIQEYDELVEVTRSYMNESLSGIFESLDAAGFDGTEAESYRVKGVQSVEYHINSTWIVEESKIPSSSDLHFLVTKLFEGTTLQSYLEKLHAELPSSNVFSSTTAVVFVQLVSETEGEGFETASAADDNNGNNTVERSKTMIALSIAGGGLFSCLVILAIYCRRRGQVGDIGNAAMKPDTAECSTLDTHPMIQSDSSFHWERVKGGVSTELVVQESAHELDGHFSEIRLNEI